jgi:hypothetical protein
MKIPRKRMIVSVAVVAALLGGSATITAFALNQPETAVAENVPSSTPTPAETFTKVSPRAIPSKTASPPAAPAEMAEPVVPAPAGRVTNDVGTFVPPPDEPVWEDAPVYVPPPPIEYETITTQVCETAPEDPAHPGNAATVCRIETTTRPKQ